MPKCSVCQISIISHLRCLKCGILLGEKHYAQRVSGSKLCYDCLKRERIEKVQLKVHDRKMARCYKIAAAVGIVPERARKCCMPLHYHCPGCPWEVEDGRFAYIS